MYRFYGTENLFKIISPYYLNISTYWHPYIIKSSRKWKMLRPYIKIVGGLVRKVIDA